MKLLMLTPSIHQLLETIYCFIYKTLFQHQPQSHLENQELSNLHLSLCSTMALARLALKNLQQRASYSGSLLAKNAAEKQRWFLRGLSSAAEEKAHEVAVQEAEGGKKPKRRRGGNLWRRDGRDFVPALWDMFDFHRGLGNALENINRVVEKIAPQAREHEDSYKLRYEMPGMGKDDVKITVEDRILSIRGEHQQKEDSDDEFWSSSTYNTSLLLPEDAKLDEIKAEMKDGVLNILIPKAEKAHKDVKEVEVH
ncbi:26.5 kDa heat shock protein, mitochondrial [Salvia miltiorrhiza]|uniref:26.5 kDa heat shock protein, mitochondrial n=1 Tax=Salvia miltiorrhiza TaxID=226208 RepID=UPI0025ACAF27|nr:26.5 kDa heat shock protein, mitochondrial [Salvia miltiorrhiza]